MPKTKIICQLVGIGDRITLITPAIPPQHCASTLVRILLIAQPKDLIILSTDVNSYPGSLQAKSLSWYNVQFINEYHGIATLPKIA